MQTKDRFFFALRPPPHAIASLRDIRPAARPGEQAVDDTRLHLTMFMLGDFPTRPDTLLAQAMAAASTVALPAFRVTFDRLVVGAGRALLSPSELILGLEQFQMALRKAMHRVGIGPPRWWRYGAPMTLLYGTRPPSDVQIDSIGWRAEDFVLIRSALGRTNHTVLGRWPLATCA